MQNRALQSLLVAALLSGLSLANAGPAAPGQLQLKNKDGYSFNGRLQGDEWLSWIETGDGDVVIKNKQSGDYEYAQIRNGELQPSGIKVGGPAPASSAQGGTGRLKTSHADFRSLLRSHQRGNQNRHGAPSVSGGSAVSGGAGAPLIPGHGHDHGPNSGWNHLTAPPATIPLLVVILEFNDQQLRSPVSSWSQKIFGEAPGQMNHFWKTVSNNKFKFVPAVETEGTANDGIMKVRLAMNHPNHQGSVGTTERHLALDQLDGHIDYARYDTNRDNMLAKEELQIIYLYAGGESSSGSTLPSVWAHKTSEWTNVVHDGVSFQNNYSRFGERHFSPPNDNDATYGIIAHELGHAAFNLPDLYDYDSTSGGVDSYCLMSYGSWGSAVGELMGASPTAPSAWVRYRLGFTEAAVVTPGTPLSQTLKPQSRQGGITLIPTDAPAEYFLVENRYAEGTDISLAGTGAGGALVWHIDETMYSNSDDARRLVDYENDPNQYQPYWPMGASTAFNATSTPNSKDNNGAVTGVTVSSFARLSDADHSVSFTAEKRLASTYPAMHFRGTPNNWVATPMTLVSSGVWQTTQNFAAGVTNPRFKFDVSGNWTTNFGDTNRDGLLEQGGGDIPVTTPGNYVIRLTEATMRYTITPVNLPPVANAGPDQTVYVDQVVTLDGSASRDPDGSIVSYSWNNGRSGVSPTISYSAAGTYIVTLTVTDNAGATASDDVIIEVRPNLPNQLPTARFTVPAAISAGSPVTLNGSTSSDPDGTISSYVWTISGASGTLSGATPSYTFPAAGSYTVSLFVIDNRGGQSPVVSSTVTVGPAAFRKVYPQVYYRGTSNGWGTDKTMSLTGDNLWAITVVMPNTSAQSFKFDVYGNWTTNFGDNNADGLAEQSGGNISIPAGGGTYVITFNDSTRRYTLSKQTSGNQAPVAVVPASQTITGAATASLNGSASYDSDGTIASYRWTQTAGPSVTISNAGQATASVALPAVSATTTYRFTLTVTDNSGATGTAEHVITQNPTPSCTSAYSRMNLRGTSNSWGTTAMTLSSDCFWEAVVTFGSTTTERFKFDVNGDWAINFGDTNRDGIAEQTGADIPVSTGAGIYLIRFNDVSKRYTVIKQ